jgi:hypothetical protein
MQKQKRYLLRQQYYNFCNLYSSSVIGWGIVCLIIKVFSSNLWFDPQQPRACCFYLHMGSQICLYPFHFHQQNAPLNLAIPLTSTPRYTSIIGPYGSPLVVIPPFFSHSRGLPRLICLLVLASNFCNSWFLLKLFMQTMSPSNLCLSLSSRCLFWPLCFP